MPGLLFSGTNIATVAYVEVLSDGTSPNVNSGVETAHPNPGEYTVTLPANDAQPSVASSPSSGGGGAMYIVCPKGSTPCSFAVEDTASPPPAGVANGRVKTIRFESGGSPFDTDFDFIVLRPTITAPAGGPG